MLTYVDPFLRGEGGGMKPRLFVELCARTAAVSLALQGGPRCKPPVSGPGCKTGYVRPILDAAGLRPGQGADGYLWCEPEAGPRSVLATYSRPEALQETAATIRGWIGEPAKDLWLRLREEERAAPGTSAARWLLLSRWSFSGKGWEHGYGGPGSIVRTKEGANWTTEQRDEALERPRAARLLEEMIRTDWPPVVIGEDARAVEPASVARWLATSYLSWKGDPAAGFRATGGGDWPNRPPELANMKFPVCGEWPPVVIGPDAREVGPYGDLEGVVVYFDPPYRGKTGYQHDLPRADVVTIARRWADAGALVIVSEAEPVAELGWECMEISAARRGNARTYGATAEWLTMSRPPVHRVAVQVGMWGAA